MNNRPTLLIPFLFLSLALHGQVKAITTGINGLTCSMCSRTVEKSILNLLWVEKVEMSLENTEAKIFPRKNTNISMKEIVRSVKDAGFSVRFVKMEMDADGLRLQEDNIFYSSGQEFRLAGNNKIPEKGTVIFRLIDPLYTTPKDHHKWAALLPKKPEKNVLHVVIE
ncbi:MAG: heavy-metal-associated domain-containing protein [Cyclobacteriaceae bacterium]